MIQSVACAAAETLQSFDDIIDVRTPAEFAEDHVPGAVNLPVLSNVERAHVGTMWSQQSKFEARRTGAALIARNVASHLEGALSEKTGSWRPLVYCWRGGQRSGAMARILSEVGWRVGVLQGGYKTYRRSVVETLYERPVSLSFVVLCGGTGVGKTDLLGRLGRLGVQSLDLEDLANHRGSLFGGRAGQSQPGQKLFETRLAATLKGFDPGRPVAVEDESSRIGDLFLPSSLWAALVQAPRIVLDAPPEARARHVVRRYPDLLSDRAKALEAIEALPRHLARESKDRWRAMLAQGAFADLALELIRVHYDPAYARQAKDRLARWPLVTMTDLGDADLEAAARAVAAIIDGFFGAAGGAGEEPGARVAAHD